MLRQFLPTASEVSATLILTSKLPVVQKLQPFQNRHFYVVNLIILFGERRVECLQWRKTRGCNNYIYTTW